MIYNRTDLTEEEIPEDTIIIKIELLLDSIITLHL